MMQPLSDLPTWHQRRGGGFQVVSVAGADNQKQGGAGTSPRNAVVRETIVERQVHFQSSD